MIIWRSLFTCIHLYSQLNSQVQRNNTVQCADKCSVNGMNYDVGERFKKDCEICTCYGNDVIHCEEKNCPCFINSKIVFHEGKFTLLNYIIIEIVNVI